MLRATINGRTRRPRKLRAVSVWLVDVRAARRPSEVRSINLVHPPVAELYGQHLVTTDLPCQHFLRPEFGAKSQRAVRLFLELPEFPYNTVKDR